MSVDKNSLPRTGNQQTVGALKEWQATLERLRAGGKPRFDSLEDYFKKMDEMVSDSAKTATLKAAGN